MSFGDDLLDEETPATTYQIAIVVSILLLFFSVAAWPYGYYVLLKISLTVTGLLLWNLYSGKKQNWSYFYLGVAILFNPIFRVPLGRELWTLVGLVVLPPLFITLFTLKKYLHPTRQFEERDE